MRGIWVVMIVVVGCGDEAKPAEETVAPEEVAVAEEKEAVEEAPAAAFDASAFCAAVFASEDVAKIVGVDELAPLDRGGRIPEGMAECKLEATDENGMPMAMASALVDCRGVSLNVDKHRTMAKSMSRGKEDAYRELDIGKGGAWVRTTVLDKPTYTISFVHAETPCSATVAHSFIDADHVEALARHVHDRITEANRPRK